MQQPPDSQAEVTFASVLTDLMRARDINQAQLAKALSQSTGRRVYDAAVARWRTGEGGISHRNAQAVADYFGVDRAYMARLAGYADNSLPTEEGSIDPEIDALLNADRAEVRDYLAGIPGPFRTAVILARRNAGRAVADALRQAGISKAVDDKLAGHSDGFANHGQSDDSTGKGGLIGSFQASVAY